MKWGGLDAVWREDSVRTAVNRTYDDVRQTFASCLCSITRIFIHKDTHIFMAASLTHHVQDGYDDAHEGLVRATVSERSACERLEGSHAPGVD